MDPCDKVSRLLKCGKDNSPEAVAGLMKNIENTITVISKKEIRVACEIKNRFFCVFCNSKRYICFLHMEFTRAVAVHIVEFLQLIIFKYILFFAG